MKHVFSTLGPILCALFATVVTAGLCPAPIEPASRIYPGPVEWKGTRILHIGDSNLANWGLKGTLRRKFKKAGANYKVSSWVGSNSRSWLVSGKLKKLMRSQSPNVVLVNLGTNSIRHKRPRLYSKWIKRMVNKIQPRKCYWISPPPLIEDEKGFYEILRRSSSPCRFFDSRRIDFHSGSKRHFHLSRKESAMWAEKIWKWMNSQNCVPKRQDGI